MRRTPAENPWSTTKKKAAAMNTITNTIAVVTTVSLRLGQVTRETSWRTCCRNSTGLVFAITLISPSSDGHHLTAYGLLPAPVPGSLPPAEEIRWYEVKDWQEWRGSNPQPPVLETGALPVELHSFAHAWKAQTCINRAYNASPLRRLDHDGRSIGQDLGDPGRDLVGIIAHSQDRVGADVLCMGDHELIRVRPRPLAQRRIESDIA